MPQNQDLYSKYGAKLFVVSVIIFIAAMVIAQSSYPCIKSVCYNIGTNPISDLGNTLTSPAWPIFNYGLIIFGTLLFAGLLFLKDTFPKGVMGRAGLIFLILSAFGAMGVGTVPENTILAIHSLFALISFMAGGLGVLLIGLSIKSGNKLNVYKAYTIISGIITLVVLLVFTLPLGLGPFKTSGSGFGFGGIERTVVGPVVLWVFLTGIMLLTKRKLY